MGVTSYISTHGMIWGEVSDSGVTRSYGHDALGSVTETFVNGALENTYRYKPYGSLLAKTGAAADPSFLWNGGSGYRATALAVASHYVSARHFSCLTGQWTTIDNLWPQESAFVYSNSNPTTKNDPSGNGPPGGCSYYIVDKFIQPKGCEIAAGYFGSKCQNGKPLCKLIEDIKSHGTLTFVLWSSCRIGSNNPCTETMDLDCNKHIEIPPKGQKPFCKPPNICGDSKTCNENITTGFTDPGPLSGTISFLGEDCKYRITDIKFVGWVKATTTASVCSPPKRGGS